MTINEYYTRELQALRVLGAEFSEKNPGLSSFLARKGQDPDVERLLEGFAFLSGRLHQYIDEELPEVSHALAQLLWPNYLRPVPSFAILQFDPSKDDSTGSIPKGEEVMAVHPENSERCIFQTCYETTILPLDVTGTEYYTHGTKGVLELEISAVKNSTLGKVEFDRLRFYIGNHEHLSDNLYYHLMNHVESITLTIGRNGTKRSLSPKNISPVGFEEDEHILPVSKNVFAGYTLLQEYFCFRGKYHFIEVSGLDILKTVPGGEMANAKSFTIKIVLSEKLKITKTVTNENFRLYCTPIINIFSADAEPIRKSLQEEYEVIPAGTMYKNSEVYGIESVRGWDSKAAKYRSYLPFESFKKSSEAKGRYYTRVKLSDDLSRTRTYIRFNNSLDGFSGIADDIETVSLEISVTNRDLPSTLDIGDISLTTARSTISNVTFRNITVPTRSYTPPIHNDLLWRIISSMSLNYLALDSIDTLRSVLEIYDFPGASDLLQKKQTESLLSGLVSLSYEPAEMIYKGLPVRGIISRLKMDSGKFSTIGEAYLLATVLNRFFSLFCSINSFHKLEVTIDKKAKFSWQPYIGEHALL